MRVSAVRTFAVLAALSLSAIGATAQAPAGQTPAPAPAQDFSKVDIKTTKLAGNFYTLVGAGGTIGVLTGPDGVFMVDAQFAPLTDKIVAAIRQISDRPIRFVVNTHQHGDHTGGNANLAKMGVTLIARDELRAGLEKIPATPPGGLPLITYRGAMTIHMDGEDVQIIPVPAAHTSGDTMVRFPAADVIMTGDFYRSLGYPNIDRANGGTAKGMIDGFNAIIQLAGPNTKIVPGHGDVVDKAAVVAHRDMMIVVRDRVEALVKQGKTLPDIMAAKPTSDYDSKVPQGPMTIERFVTQLYGELGGK
jgi:cyclase